MPDTEQLAQYVAANSQYMAEEDQKKGKNWMLPPLPKPGEYIICQICGRTMMPKDFSTNQKIRAHEFKWHVHWSCEQNIFDQLDRGTPGLIAERKDNSYLNEYRAKIAKKAGESAE